MDLGCGGFSRRLFLFRSNPELGYFGFGVCYLREFNLIKFFFIGGRTGDDRDD